METSLKNIIISALYFYLIIPCAFSADIIKFGTLATKNSDWAFIFEEMKDEIFTKSNGELELKFYYAQDESDLIEYLKKKQFDAVSLTIPGLGQILPEIFILQLPYLFSSYEELDFVRDKITPYYEKQFTDKGYKILGWGDLGYGYIYSKIPIRTQSDLQKSRLWVWDIDPVAKAFASESGRAPILLPIHSVLPSLESDEIQTVYAPPLGCLIYQWQKELKYFTDFPLTVGVGATIISKSRFDKLNLKNQKMLKDICWKYHQKLIPVIRTRNSEAINILERQGIITVKVPTMEKEKWFQAANRVQMQLADQLYPKEVLERIKKLKEDFRQRE